MLEIFLKWFKTFSKKIAAAQTLIILTIVYIVFVPFFALILRLSRKKKYTQTGWVPWRFESIEDIKKQF